MIVRIDKPYDAGLSPAEVSFIRNYYSDRKTSFIAETLNSEELFVIKGTHTLSRKDYLALAKTKRILDDVPLSEYIDQEYTVADEHRCEYIRGQLPWMEHERHLLQWELFKRGVNRPLKMEEFNADFRKHRNGLRYKIFYLLSHPNRVVRRR